MKKRVFLTSIITIAILVASCLLLILPGQFATIKGQAYSGYEVIFHYANIDGINYLAENNPNTSAIVTGILGLVFILFAFVSLIFAKKSTALPIIGGSFSFLAGLMFITMQLALNVMYKGLGELRWVSYLIGSLLIVFGVILVVLGAFAVKEESTVAATKQNYSYLKSNKK